MINMSKGNKEERKCKGCGKTLVGKNKTGFCSACKKTGAERGTIAAGVLAFVGSIIFGGIKTFKK